MDVNELSDFDIFFYYGEGDLEIETKSDILMNLLQDKRSLLYNADEGAGISAYENFPNANYIRVLLPYLIVDSLSRRNSNVSNGENGLPDRRVAVSQSTIFIENSDSHISISVYYVPLTGLQPKSIEIKVGV